MQINQTYKILGASPLLPHRVFKHDGGPTIRNPPPEGDTDQRVQIHVGEERSHGIGPDGVLESRQKE